MGAGLNCFRFSVWYVDTETQYSTKQGPHSPRANFIHPRGSKIHQLREKKPQLLSQLRGFFCFDHLLKQSFSWDGQIDTLQQTSLTEKEKHKLSLNYGCLLSIRQREQCFFLTLSRQIKITEAERRKDNGREIFPSMSEGCDWSVVCRDTEGYWSHALTLFQIEHVNSITPIEWHLVSGNKLYQNAWNYIYR